MVYLIFGSNSYVALNKILELKQAFFKKAGSAAISDFSEEELAKRPREAFSQLFQDSLFFAKKLVILRNASSAPDFFRLMEESAELFRTSRNIFVFWESATAKAKGNKALETLKKISEKTQEAKILSVSELDRWLQKKEASFGLKLTKEERDLMIVEAGDGAEWALENELEKMALGGEAILGEKPPGSSKPGFETAKKPGFFPPGGFKNGAASPFAFVEKIFSSSFGRALLELKEAEASGQDLQKFIYPLLWKAKQKKMPDAYWQGILAESAMRRNPKNVYEILEHFILAIK